MTKRAYYSGLKNLDVLLLTFEVFIATEVAENELFLATIVELDDCCSLCLHFSQKINPSLPLMAKPNAQYGNVHFSDTSGAMKTSKIINLTPKILSSEICIKYKK
jgi:hypothetical protein